MGTERWGQTGKDVLEKRRRSSVEPQKLSFISDYYLTVAKQSMSEGIEDEINCHLEAYR